MATKTKEVRPSIEPYRLDWSRREEDRINYPFTASLAISNVWFKGRIVGVLEHRRNEDLPRILYQRQPDGTWGPPAPLTFTPENAMDLAWALVRAHNASDAVNV